MKKRGGGYGFGLGGLALPTSTHLISIVSSRHKFESYDGTMDSSSSLTAAAPSLPPLPPQGCGEITDVNKFDVFCGR